LTKACLAQLTCWPNRPVGPLGPTGLARPAGSGLGRSNRPSPALTRPSLCLSSSSSDLHHRRRHRATPAISDGHRRRHLGRIPRRCFLYQLHQVVSPAALFLRRLDWSFPPGSVAAEHFSYCFSPIWSLMSWLRCLYLVRARQYT
jgi:hypothetical protein